VFDSLTVGLSLSLVGLSVSRILLGGFGYAGCIGTNDDERGVGAPSYSSPEASRQAWAVRNPNRGRSFSGYRISKGNSQGYPDGWHSSVGGSAVRVGSATRRSALAIEKPIVVLYAARYRNRTPSEHPDMRKPFRVR
jgi:hypothetical protein